MKLLVHSTSKEFGGVERHLEIILRAVGDAGWRTCHARREMSGARGLQALLNEWRAFFHTLRLLRRERPTASFHSLAWPTDGLGAIGACALWGLPTILVFHNASPQLRLRGPQRWLYRRFYRRQKWVTVSHATREGIARKFGVPSQDIAAALNWPLQPCRAEQRASARSRLLAELRLSEPVTLVTTLARLAPEKGHRELLTAIAELRGEFPRARYLWGGEGPERDALCGAIARAGLNESVFILGHRDVEAVLPASDLFVLPSRWEGSPFAIAEAMSAGVPIVASEVGGIPEMVAREKQALLFRAGDASALTQALRRALSAPQKMRLLAEEAKVAAAGHSWRETAEPVLKALRNFVDLAGK